MKRDDENESKQILHEELILEVDQALKEDVQKRLEIKQRNLEQREEEVGRLALLPKLLRIIGAIVLLISAGTFMLQGWDSMSHLLRYFSFLGFTSLLAAAGFFCGLRVKEDKGARTFLGVAAAIIPAHFCQLGALLYSKFGPGVVASNYPSYAYWVAGTGLDAVLTTSIALLVLVPIALMAFSALARSEAPAITVAYIAFNSLLLIPVREASAIGFLGLAGLLALVYIDSNIFQKDSAMKTKEGILVRFMLSAPIVLLYLRSIHLYDTTMLFLSSIYAAVAICMFLFSPLYFKESVAKGLQSASVLPAAISWCMLVDQIHSIFGLPGELGIPLLTLPFALLLLLMSAFCLGSPRSYQIMAALAAIAGAVFELLAYPGIGSSVFCVAVGIASIAYGYTVESKFVFFSGLFTLVHGLLHCVKLAMSVITISPWLGLAIIGALTILGSSYLEVHVRKVVQHLGDFRRQLRAWS